MQVHRKFFFLSAVICFDLFSCSSQKAGASALPIEPIYQNQITLDSPRSIRFQLPDGNWKLHTFDGIPCLLSPSGSRIIFLDENAGESNPETRTGLLLDRYAENSAILKETWTKAETQVISINKPMGSLPATNIMWIANKAGKEVAVLHFYQKGKIFTIRVEGAENNARENLVALLSGVEIQ